MLRSSRLGLEVRGPIPLAANAAAKGPGSRGRARSADDASSWLSFFSLCTALGLFTFAHSADAGVLEHNFLVALSIVLMLVAVKGGGVSHRTQSKTR